MGALLLDTVDKQVAGTVVVPLATFRTTLGTTAYRVWCQLREVRRPDGTCTKPITTFQGVHPRSAKKALARLRGFGLVSPARWSAGVYARKVAGGLGIDANRGDIVLVPGRTWKALQLSPKWGGKRSGAGRKPKVPEIAQVPDNAEKIIQEGPTPNQEGPTPIKINQEGPRPLLNFISTPKPQVLEMKRHLSPDKSGTKPANYNTNNTTSSYRLSSPSLRSGEESEPGSAGLSFLKIERDNFICGGGSPRTWVYAGVPEIPGPSVVPPVVVPPPPLIDFQASIGEQVEMLVKAYQAAVQRHTGRRSGVFRRRGAVDNYFDLLSEAAEQFAEHEIRPDLWIEFSFEVWGQNHNLSKSLPPVKFIFGSSRIAKKRGWYRSWVGHTEFFGKTYPLKSHQDVMRLHARMRTALLDLENPTDAEVRQVVEHYFPNGLYDRLVKKAQSEAKEKQAVLVRRVQAGAWLWA